MSKIIFYVGVALFLLIIFYIIYRKNFKVLNFNSIALITGAPKTGKDAICCKFSQKDYKKIHRHWWFLYHIFRLKYEEPLFYTNAITSFKSIHSKKPHRLDKNIRFMSLDLMLREKRFNYKSVCWITEGSLFADNMFFNDQNKNVQLTLFAKLFTHETRGGEMFISTQNPQDLHYSFKRVCGNFLFIQKKINFLNLFLICWVREMISDDLGANNFIDDVDTTTRKVLVPRWWFKRYDRYQFSVLTDNLDLSDEKIDKNNLVVSFNPKYNEFAYAKRVLDVKKEKEGTKK